MKQFSLVVCGGTFDHFHKGHEAFLRYAFSVGRKIIVGLTSGNFVKSEKRKAKNEKQIEPFGKRKQAVLEFIKSRRILDRAEIVKIDDLFGPTLWRDLQIDALVISQDTKRGGNVIVQKRQELSLSPLKVFIAPAVYAEDGRLISSGRIRNGEINREGKLYVNPLWFKSDLTLPENLRVELRKPLGVLIETEDLRNSAGVFIAVGDVTTKKFNELFLSQHISVVDFKVGRAKKFSTLKELGFLGSEKVLRVENPAGCLTPDLFKTCQEVWRKKGRTVIHVEGEEDLTVLPLVLTAPLGAAIFYGQPEEGIVKVEVSEEKKEKIYRLVSGFSTRGH